MNGTADQTVSRQWANRPDDQRFLTLDELETAVKWRHEHSREVRANVRDMSCMLTDGGDDLRMDIPALAKPAEMTHFSFDALSRRVGAPANFLRELPVELAAECLNHKIQHADNSAIMPYVMENGRTTLRAATSQIYGRIYDDEVVDAVQRLVRESGIDWKVPGVLNWGTGRHNSEAEVTKQSTTLYASDRDVFIFLVDDRNPIEVGKLENGEPDMLFRGFYVFNSECGTEQFGLATMYMRAVCANRILWGVEGKREIIFRHTKNAPARFLNEATPALLDYVNSNTSRVVAGVNRAKEPVLPVERPDKVKWIMNHAKVQQNRAIAVLNAVEAEEGKVCMSVWDVAQGLTAVARRIPHQDQRVDLERAAKRILDAVAA